jgi:hypothetical protein
VLTERAVEPGGQAEADQTTLEVPHRLTVISVSEGEVLGRPQSIVRGWRTHGNRD